MNFQTNAAEYLIDFGFKPTSKPGDNTECLIAPGVNIMIGPNWIEVKKFDNNFNTTHRANFTTQSDMDEMQIMGMFDALGVVPFMTYMKKAKEVISNDSVLSMIGKILNNQPQN